jgi:hypothetical protein
MGWCGGSSAEGRSAAGQCLGSIRGSRPNGDAVDCVWSIRSKAGVSDGNSRPSSTSQIVRMA